MDDKFFKLGMVAATIVEDGRGVLAIDETAKSMGKKLKAYGIENSLENRNVFRELLVTTPGLERSIGGIIFNEETFGTRTADGKLLTEIIKDRGIAVGIKLDKGLIDFNDHENVSIGLEDLAVRIKLPIFKNADFAKWRCLFYLNGDCPTPKCIEENCRILAEYARICQENGLVPIVEPELFIEGEYSITKSFKILKVILSRLIYELNLKEVFIPGVLIKTSFVSAGSTSTSGTTEMSKHTLDALMSAVPCAIPGIVFLSGGHDSSKSIELLALLNRMERKRAWKLSFSYGRALTDPAMRVWAGEIENLASAQVEFKNTVEKCFEAAKGKPED